MSCVPSSIIDLTPVSQVLDSPVFPSAASGHHFFTYRNQLRRLSLKVAITYDKFPTPLVLRGVQCDTTNQHGAGGFADVFCGTYNGEKVALKRLRVYLMMTDEQKTNLKKVRTGFLRVSSSRPIECV